MFGRMTATPLVRLDAGNNLDVAVAELLATTDYPQIARWSSGFSWLDAHVPRDRSRRVRCDPGHLRGSSHDALRAAN